MGRPKKSAKVVTDSPLKQLRTDVKISQERLAREMGVAVSSIRRWEKGECEPTMTVAQMKNFCLSTKQRFEDLPYSLIPNR